MTTNDDTATSIPDVGRLVQDELDRRAAHAQRADLLARNARVAAGGPCAFCGIPGSVRPRSERVEKGEDADEPWWGTSPLGPVCVLCVDDRNGVDDLTHRGAVAIDLLGLERQWQPTQLGKRIAGAFRWWAEITPRPPAPTSVADRFAHVDRAALLAAMAPPTPHHHDGPACPDCGRANAWIYEPSIVEAYQTGERMINAATTPGDRCANCGHFEAQPAPPPDTTDYGTSGLTWLGSPDPFAGIR